MKFKILITTLLISAAALFFLFGIKIKQIDRGAKVNSDRVRVNVDLDKNVPVDISHNYIFFKNIKTEEKTAMRELNGYSITEYFLLLSLGERSSIITQNYFKNFMNKNLFGFLVSKFADQGKPYFINSKPVYLPYDSDDTASGYRFFHMSIPDGAVTPFLSSERLVGEFQKICDKIRCNYKNIIRTWATPYWPSSYDIFEFTGLVPYVNDINIVAMANMTSYLNLNSTFQKQIFAENKRYINEVIEQYDYTQFYRYFEPKVTGVFLLLLYDRIGNPYLSLRSKQILTQRLIADWSLLKRKPLSAASTSLPVALNSLKQPSKKEGFYVFYCNDRIPVLERAYVVKYMIPKLMSSFASQESTDEKCVSDAIFGAWNIDL